MITERTCYVVTCTECGEKLDYDDYFPHFDTAEEARSLLPDCDWWTDGNVELCDPCRSKPHAFVPEVAERYDVACDRCGLDYLDHETAPTEAGA